MEKMVNGYSVLDLDLYRQLISKTARQLACDAEKAGLERAAQVWDEKAEIYRKMTDEEISFQMDLEFYEEGESEND